MPYDASCPGKAPEISMGWKDDYLENIFEFVEYLVTNIKQIG
jgi:hypothetical protein